MKVRHRKQARHVGIVHTCVMAHSVSLIYINSPVFVILNCSVSVNPLPDLLPKAAGLFLQCGIYIKFMQDLLHIAQNHHGKHIGRHQITVDTSVIAGAEARPRHPGNGYRVPRSSLR